VIYTAIQEPRSRYDGAMRSSWMVAAAVVAVATATAHAQQARAYIEKFVGWSKDGTFYAITDAGTD